MSGEALAAALAALWDVVYPWALGAWAGWYFRGWALARRRREEER